MGYSIKLDTDLYWGFGYTVTRKTEMAVFTAVYMCESDFEKLKPKYPNAEIFKYGYGKQVDMVYVKCVQCGECFAKEDGVMMADGMLCAKCHDSLCVDESNRYI